MYPLDFALELQGVICHATQNRRFSVLISDDLPVTSLRGDMGILHSTRLSHCALWTVFIPSIRDIWYAPHNLMYAAGYATIQWSERKFGLGLPVPTIQG